MSTSNSNAMRILLGKNTNKAFCKTPQMHDQMTGWLKNTPGAIDNLDDPSTVLRELVVCPEMVRLIHEFERNEETEKQTHHEQYTLFQEDWKYVYISRNNLNIYIV